MTTEQSVLDATEPTLLLETTEPYSLDYLTTAGYDENGWLAWAAWSECSKTCGEGKRERWRGCPSRDCLGDSRPEYAHYLV